ncbi:MAG TPA: carboxypeptidase-like regulatory domain-containing protein, partial [Bacteroidia bacterium]|nr:carboxypeptidase-like regulatory domain-containing protein [Bacteroidia bacterium]
VQGRVFAADGATPVPWTSVQVFDQGGLGLTSTSTDENGNYLISSLQAPPDGFVVRALSPTGDAFVEQPGSFTSSGQTVTIDLTLPIAALTGTVR